MGIKRVARWQQKSHRYDMFVCMACRATQGQNEPTNENVTLASIVKDVPLPALGQLDLPVKEQLARCHDDDEGTRVAERHVHTSTRAPLHLCTSRTKRAGNLAKKYSSVDRAGSTAAIWGDEDAATAGNTPAATSPATELLRDASSGVPGRRKTERARQSTPLSKKKSAGSTAAIWGEENAAAAAGESADPPPAPGAIRNALSLLPGHRKTPKKGPECAKR